MRRTPTLTYPIALIVFLWAEIGIIRAHMPVAEHHNVTPAAQMAMDRPVSASAQTDRIADARPVAAIP